MKSKTLLIAAAALVAGVVTSEAQVYSANIVGYVNVTLPGNGQYTLIANPLDDGNGNILSNIVTAPLPGGVSNPLGQSKITTFGIPTAGVPNTISKLASGAWNANPSLPPGTGFYVQNGKPGGNAPDLTNTFVGNVVATTVSPNITNNIPSGLSLQGSAIPLAGNIAVSGTPGGDANLNYGGSLNSPSTSARSTLTLFTVGTQSPATVTKLVSGNWNGTAAIGVAQGFYINNLSSYGATNMVQTLP